MRQTLPRLRAWGKSGYHAAFSRILRFCNSTESDALFYHPDTPGKASESSNPAHLERLKTAVNYIEAHYQEPIRIQDAALECGYSESHFMRWFKQMTGTSFIRYLNRYRLEHAFSKLRTTEKTVLEISEESGFDNLSNFNRQFKKQFGVTPRELRES